METVLDKDDYVRYNRHIRLDEIGEQGQQKLKSARVLVVGAGGLGCPVLQYLVAAGVGTIGIVDDDKIENSNLQRQILFGVDDLGKPKAEVAAEKLRKQNPLITIDPIPQRLKRDNALQIMQSFDFVIDGSDNFPTRYLVSDACVILKKPLIFGSIFKFEGQVSVFNYQGGPTYRCLFPEPPEEGSVPNCSEIGVLGVLPGLIGTMMAAECLKMILGVGQVLSGKLLMVDTLKNNYLILDVSPSLEHHKRTELEQNYEINCKNDILMKNEITVTDLNEWLQQGKDFQILDVRNSDEIEICAIDPHIHIPLNELPSRVGELPKNKLIVSLCHRGIRSYNAMKFLKSQGFEQIVSVKGGIHQWASQIDQTMNKY